jgi:predicted TPR repeat methyltransferase
MDPRTDWMMGFVTGKSVLDLGCVRHSIEETEKPGWLHGEIKKVAQRIVGVDYLEQAVLKLKQKNYDVVCANVEVMQLDERFDTIVAGDLIEHLNNFGMFIERVKEHLNPNGVFILTTPNPVNLLRFISVLFRGDAGANPEHTCWFTERVIRQLFDRYGFEPIDIQYVDDSYQYYCNWKWVLFFPFNYILVKIRPQFAETLCIAFRLKRMS